MEEKDRFVLIEECYMDVARYLAKFHLKESDYYDAIQDTFVEAFSRAHTLREPEKVKHWMIKIAKSKGLKYKRKNSILLTIECAFKEDVIQLNCSDRHEDEVLKELISKADKVELLEAMKCLKEKEQSVLIHHYIYDEKLKDIAIIIGESLTNTKTISRRAKEKLRNFLTDGGYEDGK